MRPPDRMSSNPPMPVLTRSRSGMGCFAASRRARPQQHFHRVPSIRRGAEASQGLQPFLGAIDFEDEHPSGGAPLRGPRDQPDAQEQIERARDVLGLVPDVRGELLAAEDDPRMAREEQQQVEVARVSKSRHGYELLSRGAGRLALRDTEA